MAEGEERSLNCDWHPIISAVAILLSKPSAGEIMKTTLHRCFLIALLALNSTAYAEKASCSRPILIPASPLGLSMQIDANNQLSGITPDFFSVLTKESGCRFEYVVVPRARAELMFLQGEVDIFPTATQSASRDQAGTFIPVMSSLPALITTKKVSGDPEEILASGQLRVNIVRGYSYGPDYDRLVRQLTERDLLESVSSPDIVARKMAADRIDATIMSTPVFASAARENQLDDRLLSLPFTAWTPLPAGVYLSGKRLNAKDFALLKKLLEKRATSAYFLEAFRSRAPHWATLGVAPIAGPAQSESKPGSPKTPDSKRKKTVSSPN